MNPALYQLPDNFDPPSDPFNGEDEDDIDDDIQYKCDCGVVVPRIEATTRMVDYCNCEDCDSSTFD